MRAIFEVFSLGPICQFSASPFIAICSIELVDLKSVGRRAIVELGWVRRFAGQFGPPVHEVSSCPPPTLGATMIGCSETTMIRLATPFADKVGCHFDSALLF